MSGPSNGVVVSPLGSRDAAAAAGGLSETRPLYWSVRRELWESRSIYAGPLVAAGVFLFGYLISMVRLPQRRRAALLLDAAEQHAAIMKPFDVAAIVIIVTGLIVAVFYCLDALYGERRDRSILFWKSLPVSDLTTVLSKACIPLAVLPVIVFGISVTTQVVMLLMSSVVLLMNGLSAATTWKHFSLVPQSLILLYGLAVHALWHAPIYAWLLLVSAWARRTPFLWAVLPPLAIGVVERTAFNTSYFGSLLGYRVGGAMPTAFALEGQGPHAVIDRLSQLDPARFLASAGLWSGLLFAAGFLVAAARVRRHRDPI